eukprot:CAMPEP_0114255842 /NCGR_PEP_ID=MMETSP0058-20121206/17806_1 /TAXON_ID=36894 /ORGANISM="Pyramimonas parkeae, CCMP726" /LENGTH=140 /DNA_ID=CAMNT_0001370311 /DNA_START=114 /DNA_END=536 /DNA_ORIENTATION=+
MKRHRDKKKEKPILSPKRKALSKSSFEVRQKALLEHKDKERRRAWLNKYDTSGDHELDFDELKALLVDLNQGSLVHDWEVYHVIDMVDKDDNFRIDIEELGQAIDQWYTMDALQVAGRWTMRMCCGPGNYAKKEKLSSVP